MLTEHYNKGRLSRTKFIELFKEVSNHTLELYREFLSLSIISNHNIINTIIKTFKHNRDKTLKAHTRNRPIVKRTELEKAGLKTWQRLKVYHKSTVINDVYDSIIIDILEFNFPEITKTDSQPTQPIRKDFNQYLEIVTALSTRLSKAEIDNLYLDEALYLVKSIQRETMREYFTTHFQGIRYATITQSSYKNDSSGDKRAKDLERIVNGFMDVITGKEHEPKKNPFISEMEKEALSVLKGKPE